MIRLVCVALISAFAASAATAQTTGGADAWRFQEPSAPPSDRRLPSLELSSTSRIGLGMFGIKADTSRSKAVIARDVTAPKQRRAGLGFSLKF